MNGIRNDGSIGIFTDAEELLLLRHTAAHILAQALKRLYPNGDIAGAEADEKGFYCETLPACACCLRLKQKGTSF